MRATYFNDVLELGEVRTVDVVPEGKVDDVGIRSVLAVASNNFEVL